MSGTSAAAAGGVRGGGATIALRCSGAELFSLMRIVADTV